QVVGRATAIPVIRLHLVSSYRSRLKHQRKSGFDFVSWCLGWHITNILVSL
ncbi:hypothetical protein B296_00038505, partial [Ensete ventricosum]